MAKIDLKWQVKATGYRKTDVELPQIEPTKAQRDELARIYLTVVRVWRAGVKERIFPAYKQALAEQIAADKLLRDRVGTVEAEIEAVDGEAVRAVLSFRGLFRAWATRLQLWHMRRFIATLTYATKVDLSTQMHAGDVTETLDDVLARNVALVRNVSDQARGRISDIVYRGLQNRTPARQVAKELREALNMSRDRSLRIAIDQTQKLSSALDRDRQLQVGMTEFEWRHSGKKHYRPEHLARNGKVYSWNSEVAKNDPPGSAPFCGCKAKGILRLD
jgi:SPP1 gp7 family putative phage head morphogenesis protein